jgi:uncharacterized membrane protein
MKKLLLLAVVLFVVLSPAYAQFTYTSIDYPSKYGTWVRGINNLGDMVGAYLDKKTGHHVLLIKNGKFIPLAPTTILGTHFSDGFKINDNGDIVGQFCDALACHGFLFSGGAVTVLDYPGATDTVALGINDDGTVVGEWDLYDADGNFLFDDGFVWKDGIFTDVKYPGSADTLLNAINHRGDVVGVWDTDPNAPVSSGFFYSRGRYISFDVPFPGITRTQPNGLNVFDLIVGSCRDANGWSYAFLDVGGYFAQLNYHDKHRDAIMTTAWDINFAGQIVGNWYDSDGNVHGWLAVPCPQCQAEKNIPQPQSSKPLSTSKTALSKLPFNAD